MRSVLHAWKDLLSEGPVGLVAGGGALPQILVDALRARGIPVSVVAILGEADLTIGNGIPHLWASLGEIGKILAFLQRHGVRQMTMAGRVRRPALGTLKVDWKGAAWIAQIGIQYSVQLGTRLGIQHSGAQGGVGDDALLRFLIRKLEEEGFQVVASQEIVASLLCAPGLLSRAEPSPDVLHDIVLGVQALRVLSSLDMGQAVVVQQGLILGAEGAEGTDALIERCGLLQREGPAGVLIKGAKTKQDLRVDVPTIGPETVRRAVQAGLQGIAFEANRTLVLSPDDMRACADQAGVFLVCKEF